MDYTYEVFISYSSADRPWATKVHDGLAARGVQAFFDRTELREGQDWEPQLRDAVIGSRHLLCLWSAKIQQTSWVHRELAMHTVRAAGAPADGSLLMLPLDGHPNYNVSLQEFVDEPLQAAYRDGIGTLDDGAWNDLLDRIAKVVRRVKDAISVPLAVLTLTQDQAQALGPAEREDVCNRLGIAPQALCDRYGATRRDWRPFGSDLTIGNVLRDVRQSINAQLKGGRTMGWDLPDDRFWTDMAQAKAFVGRMVQARIGAIVIDPVALSQPRVLGRVALFDACKRVDTIAIMVLPPFAASEQVTRFRAWVEEFGTATVQPYFEPPLDPDDVVLARCGLGVDHIDEIRRHVQMSVGQFMRFAARAGRPAHPLLSN